MHIYAAKESWLPGYGNENRSDPFSDLFSLSLRISKIIFSTQQKLTLELLYYYTLRCGYTNSI